MNQAPQQILCIEIKTVTFGSSQLNLQQLPTMTVFQSDDHTYHLATGIELIKAAILDVVSRLGSDHDRQGVYSYLSPFDLQTEETFEPVRLLFQVRVLPGNNIDALIHSIETHPIENHSFDYLSCTNNLLRMLLYKSIYFFD